MLAGSWYVVQQSRLGLPLCGDSLEEESVIREWLEFYCNRLRPLSPWEHLSHEKLLSAIEVCSFKFVLVMTPLSVLISTMHGVLLLSYY